MSETTETQNDMFGEDTALDQDKALEQLDPRTYRWEGTVRDMFDAVCLAMRKQGVDAGSVDRLAPPIVLQLCDTIGGQVGYVPRGEAVRRAMRDARLFDDWRVRGKKPPQLAVDYKLAVQTVYEIIARQRALHRQQEPDLFGFAKTGDKG